MRHDKTSKINKTNKTENTLVGMSKNIISFVVMAIIVFFTVNTAIYYALVMCAGVDIETSALIGAIISVTVIILLDYKEFHFYQKMRQFIKDI